MMRREIKEPDQPLMGRRAAAAKEMTMRLSPVLALLTCLAIAQGCVEDRPRTVTERFCSAQCELRDSCWDNFTIVPNCRQECLEDRVLQHMSDDAVEIYAECMNDSECGDLKPPDVGLLRVQDCFRKTEVSPGENAGPVPMSIHVLGNYRLQCPSYSQEPQDLVGITPEEAAELGAPVAPPPDTPAVCLDEVFQSVEPNEHCQDVCERWTGECTQIGDNGEALTQEACLTLLCPWTSETLVEFESCLDLQCTAVEGCLEGILGVFE